MSSLSSSSNIQSVPLDTFSGRQRTLGYAINGIPLPTQPYLATAPTPSGSLITTGTRFTLFFANPDSLTQSLFTNGVVCSLQFLLADGRAPEATVLLVSSWNSPLLLVEVQVLSTTNVSAIQLPFIHLQQDGSTRMTNVFGEIPEDIKDKPLLGLYDPVTHAAVAAQAGTTVTDGTNSVVYAPLASSGGGGGGGADTQYTDGGVPPTHPVGNALEFTTGSAWVTAGSASAGAGFPIQVVDGADATLGAKADTSASSDTGTFSLIALIKRVLTKLPIGQQIKSGSLSITIASDQGNLPVSGTFWQATQPISAASLPLPSNSAQESGGNLTTLAGIVSSNKAAVKAASGDFADGSLATLGLKADSAATDGSSSWSGVALLKGILTKLLGSIAVTGTFWQATQPVSISSTAPVALQVIGTGGSVPYHNISAATTNFTNVKTSACQLYGLSLSNTSASVIYVKFYDKASAPGTSDTPKSTVQVPANATVIRAFPTGLKLTNGFGWAATGGVGDADNTAIATNCVIDFDLSS